MKRFLLTAGFLAAGTMLFAGCGETTEETTEDAGTAVEPASDMGEATTDESAMEEAAMDEPAALSDIVDTAVAAKFNTLAAAVTAADLVETLKGEGPFTVFAPTDEAFAALPEGTLDDLLKPENKDKLVGILTYHVVPGKVMAADVVKLTSAKTVQGGEVTIAVEGDTVKVDGATVTTADVECSNGVIHIIDAVILPE
jgi:uncharacterized surface protein with fasciclin (FAS1) repeats